MGIDKANIRLVITNGVPEGKLSWAQELGLVEMGNKHVLLSSIESLLCKFFDFEQFVRPGRMQTNTIQFL